MLSFVSDFSAGFVFDCTAWIFPCRWIRAKHVSHSQSTFKFSIRTNEPTTIKPLIQSSVSVVVSMWLLFVRWTLRKKIVFHLQRLQSCRFVWNFSCFSRRSTLTSPENENVAFIPLAIDCPEENNFISVHIVWLRWWLSIDRLHRCVDLHIRRGQTIQLVQLIERCSTNHCWIRSKGKCDKLFDLEKIHILSCTTAVPHRNHFHSPRHKYKEKICLFERLLLLLLLCIRSETLLKPNTYHHTIVCTISIITAVGYYRYWLGDVRVIVCESVLHV